MSFVNGVICANCLTYIESTYRHDFVSCACDEDEGTGVSVDGGQDYARRAFHNKSEWIEVNDWSWWSEGVRLPE